MAHKTRKRLSKTELKKDPINDAILNSMGFLQKHLMAFVMGAGILVLVILIVQSFSASAKNQGNDAVADFYLAGQMYEMAMAGFQSGQYEMSMGQLQAARTIAINNYRAYPGRDSGQRSAVLAAKIGIIFGLEDEVIPELQDFLATDPDNRHANPARLHLAVALENRGGSADLGNARDLYTSVLGSAGEGSHMAWEARSGLSRVAFITGDLQTARENLEYALEISPDTTEFQAYQLARLEHAGI